MIKLVASNRESFWRESCASSDGMASCSDVMSHIVLDWLVTATMSDSGKFWILKSQKATRTDFFETRAKFGFFHINDVVG